MSDREPAIFISYAWGQENEIIVNQLDDALRGFGMKIIRDKRDLEYTGSIKAFMERIGTGDCVIVVISDKYLKSPNCMFELVEIAGNKQFEKRIFPVVLADADIYKIRGKFQYIKHWEDQIKDLKELLKEVDPTNLQDIYEQLNLYDRIRDNISRLTGILSDMNALTPEMHSESNFHQLYAAIEKRMREVVPLASPIPPQSPWPDPSEIIEIQDFEPETILIPAGKFLLGSNQGDGIKDYETPQHEVSLTQFRIGKYPVTNIQYAEFLKQTKKSVSPLIGWDGQKIPEGLEDHPVSHLTWYEAWDYCEWLAGITKRKYSLPNEAQWEKACRGGKDYLFPWGNEFDPALCNHGRPEIAAVNKYPPQNEFGCYDLVGNIQQWTCTLWGQQRTKPDNRYSYPWRNDARNDPGASREKYRVVRGSTIYQDLRSHRCSARRGEIPEFRGMIGFRVVINLK